MNLKIKLSKVEYFEFVNVANYYFEISKDLLNSSEYLHFYNLKGIVARIVKKHAFNIEFGRKTFLLSLTVNEYNSLKHVYSIDKNKDTYANVVIMNIFTTLDKQILDLNHILICNYNGKKEHYDNHN